MKLDKEHGFSRDEATARLRALTDYWDTRYGTRTNWDGNSAHIKGKVKGVSFDGRFAVEEKRLQGEVKVGMLAEMMGGKAYVVRKVDEYLDPANTLEALQARVTA